MNSTTITTRTLSPNAVRKRTQKVHFLEVNRMNKTRTIMAAIATSLLVGGPVSSAAAATSPQQNENSLADKCKRACPKIDEQSAKKILDWLNAHPSSGDEHGKTVAEIVAQIPQLSVEQANKI